ncbi:MAG: ABC transporter ATP-binding protein, partial [Ilumatobacteraceae bacterium]
LGVAAALKPQLSGYRNVYLGGLAIGLGRDEIDERIHEVVEFSGLGDSMSRPLKTYSSGMRARLAFSIATLRTPEILLLDEALAVGDRSFRDRSIAKINQIRENANSIVLVTHNLNEIRETCDRAVWLDDGALVADGPVEDVLTEYESWSDTSRR